MYNIYYKTISIKYTINISTLYIDFYFNIIGY